MENCKRWGNVATLHWVTLYALINVLITLLLLYWWCKIFVSSCLLFKVSNMRIYFKDLIYCSVHTSAHSVTNANTAPHVTETQPWVWLKKDLFFGCHFNILKNLHSVNTCSLHKGKWKQWSLFYFILIHTRGYLVSEVCVREGKLRETLLSMEMVKRKRTSPAHGIKGVLFITASLFHTYGNLFERTMTRLVQTEFSHSALLHMWGKLLIFRQQYFTLIWSKLKPSVVFFCVDLWFTSLYCLYVSVCQPIPILNILPAFPSGPSQICYSGL